MTRRRMKIKDVKNILGVGESERWAKAFVTPETAQILLDGCNRTNRRLDENHMLSMRRDMESNNWYDDVDLVGFAPSGLLVNGQHRLTALAGAKVDGIYLKFDFDVEQHPSMDTGKERSYSDLVRLNRKAHPDELMPNKWKTIFTTGLAMGAEPISVSLAGSEKPKPIDKFTTSELGMAWRKYGDLIRDCDRRGMFDLCKGAGASVKSAFLWAAMSGVDMDILQHIADVLKNGIASKDEDIPIIRLRDELMTMKVSGSKGVVMKCAYTHQCIFDVLRGSVSNRLNGRPILHYQMLPAL